MRWAVLAMLLAACSRQAEEDPPIPWKVPPEPAWDELPTTDAAAVALASRHAVRRSELRAFEASELASLRPDASKLLAGVPEIAVAYDGWMRADATKPAYVLFGTMHDSRAELETVASIVFRMKAPWGFALEQFRAASRWRGAPAVTTADDADLAALRTGDSVDDAALTRLQERQRTLDHAAWKFGYLDAMTELVYGARGAGMPLFGCDMPPELHTPLERGGEGERGLRELHCAQALRADARSLATSHLPDGGLSDDDPAPPERFAVLLGARHAEPDGLARFVEKDARVALVRVLGGRPSDAGGEEADLAPRLVVTDLVLVRLRGLDTILLPDATWGGTVDRATDRGPPVDKSELQPPRAAAWLPPANIAVASDVAARFAVTDSSIDVGPKPEWLSARAGHHAYVLVSAARTFVGAIDVPEAGFVEVRFSPKERAVRVIEHL